MLACLCYGIDVAMRFCRACHPTKSDRIMYVPKCTSIASVHIEPPPRQHEFCQSTFQLFVSLWNAVSHSLYGMAKTFPLLYTCIYCCYQKTKVCARAHSLIRPLPAYARYTKYCRMFVMHSVFVCFLAFHLLGIVKCEFWSDASAMALSSKRASDLARIYAERG